MLILKATDYAPLIGGAVGKPTKEYKIVKITHKSYNYGIL